MKKIIGIVIVLLMLMSVTGAWAGNAKDTQIGGEKVKVIIGFVDTPTNGDENMVRGHGGKTKYTYHIINAKAVEIPEQAIDHIKRNPRVAYVEEDAKVYALDAELDNSWGVKRIGAGVVHVGGNRGAGVKVAIIDTGIDKDHPDLQANVKGGINFVSNPSWRPANSKKWDDDNGHGTHCAGIVAAVDNEEGVIGVAPEADLYGVKVLDRTGSGYISDIVAGIEWSVDNGMQVISMSLGLSSHIVPLHSACDTACDAGIVVVAAAGNSGPSDNTVIYPAKYDSVIAVSATDGADVVASFSSRGPEVELAAPGTVVYSTVPGGYATISGTSMACPHVAGTAVLVIASGITDENNNGRINDDIRARLNETADDRGATGLDSQYGYGLVNASKAAPGNHVPFINIVYPADESIVSGEITIIAKASNDVTTVDFYIDDVFLATDTETPYSCSWDTTGVLDGSHTIKANETTGQTASDSVGVTVDNSVANCMHVASINMLFKTAGPNRNAIALVTILDESNNPVEGATVDGYWSDATSDTGSGLTDASGVVVLNSDKVKNAPSGTNFTFTVDNVVLTDWTYDPVANLETSDSIIVP